MLAGAEYQKRHGHPTQLIEQSIGFADFALGLVFMVRERSGRSGMLNLTRRLDNPHLMFHAQGHFVK